MSTISPASEQRVVLDHISWKTYLAILEDADNRRGRMAYDRGALEIMSPSKIHESIKRLIGRMIETYTEVLGIDIASVSSTTFKRDDLKRGFEADECYYIPNAGAVRDQDEINLSIDPPPDLAIEVDISRSGMNKLGIYAALRIPEVWRCDGQTIRVYTLQASGEYAEGQSSTALPDLSLTELESILSRRASASETQLIREFRASVSS